MFWDMCYDHHLPHWILMQVCQQKGLATPPKTTEDCLINDAGWSGIEESVVYLTACSLRSLSRHRIPPTTQPRCTLWNQQPTYDPLVWFSLLPTAVNKLSQTVNCVHAYNVLHVLLCLRSSILTTLFIGELCSHVYCIHVLLFQTYLCV